MGTDIHFLIETKNGFENLWELAPVPDGLYINRNYNLFAILAGVRNGFGFAGIKTGEGFKPLQEGRGLPEDLSQEIDSDGTIKNSPDEQWIGDHSHGYLTLTELENLDRTQVSRLFFEVHPEKLPDKDKAIFDNPIGFVDGDRRILSDRVYPCFGASSMPSVKCAYDITYGEVMAKFDETVLAFMKTLAEKETVSDVRIVFGFDS